MKNCKRIKRVVYPANKNVPKSFWLIVDLQFEVRDLVGIILWYDVYGIVFINMP